MHLLLFCLIFLLAPSNSFAFLEKTATTQSQASKNLPAILKADDISSDGVNNTIIATGNVEVTKGNNVITADKASYDRDDKIINLDGNIRAKNIEIGNIKASKGWAKDDLLQAEFDDSVMIFNDGSYTKSRKVKKENSDITTLRNVIYSICPNPDIAKDFDKTKDDKALISIKTKETQFDHKTNKVKIKNGTIRVYDFPLFFTPYINLPIPGKDRKSGFLYPSYLKTDRLGLGIRTPYYLNIAPNKDLTVTPQIYLTTGNFVLSNEFRHLLKQGEYNINLDLANNKVDSSNDTTIVNRTDDDMRWLLKTKGKFEFANNTGLNFDINNVGDRDYYRDYQNSYVGYTKSEINFDQIKDRNYNSIKTIRFQELENFNSTESPQFILPAINSYYETDPIFFKERLSLTTNFTAINKDSGLQYNRLSFKPEIAIPFNLHGNLFEINSSVTTNNYYLQDNFKHSRPNPNDEYNEFEFAHKPEISIDWRLPLVRKTESNIITIEPRANIIYSSYNSKNLPNEDSNDGELNASNLFESDRIAGFDRFETGRRLNYGVKSFLSNQSGQYSISLGQSLKNKKEEISIRGFNDNKSNIIGDFSYSAKKYFNIRYSFHLNESNYRNDVNQIFAGLNLNRFRISGDYLLLRRTPADMQKKQQLRLNSEFKINDKWNVKYSNTKNLVDNSDISKSIGLGYNGCCVILSITASENNLGNFIKPERSFNINLSLKNL